MNRVLFVTVLSVLPLAALAAPPKKPPPRAAARPSAPPPPPPAAPARAEEAPAPRGAPAAAAAPDPGPVTRGGPTRVEFDDRLVQGQSNKQGAIYLFERKEAPLRSMLRKRQDFRAEMADTVR